MNSIYGNISSQCRKGITFLFYLCPSITDQSQNMCICGYLFPKRILNSWKKFKKSNNMFEKSDLRFPGKFQVIIHINFVTCHKNGSQAYFLFGDQEGTA